MAAPRQEERLREWDASHSWHPFTQMQEYLGLPPLHVESGRGVWLRDTEGRDYLDGTASIWTSVHGHNDPDLNRALIEQAGKVAHSTMLGLNHPVGAELAHRLAQAAPGDLTRCFFSDNGSNAVEIALKMSFQFWQLTGRPQKRRVIAMADAYHGDTFGTMAVGDSGLFHERFRPWFFPVDRFPAPVCHEIAGETVSADSGESLAALRALLDRIGPETACLLLEPSVQGAAGMKQQPAGFVREVARLCREHEVHLILDEVFVAFGRLGQLLVCAEEEVTPDFLCLAKGLTAGYLPLAATLAREEIYEAFLGPYESYRAFFHGHTFTGNPLAAAVALASMEKLETRIDQGDVATAIDHFGQGLKQHFAGHPHMSQIRQRGLTASLDLVPDRGNASGRFPVPLRAGLQVCLAARRHGLLLRPLGDSLLLVPPICIAPDEIDLLLEKTRAALDETLPALVRNG